MSTVRCVDCNDPVESELSKLYDGRIAVCQRCLLVLRGNQRAGFC